MGMVAILVMWPGPFEQTSVTLPLGVSIPNKSTVGPMSSDKNEKANQL